MYLRFTLTNQSSQGSSKYIAQEAKTSTRDNDTPGAEVEKVLVGHRSICR